MRDLLANYVRGGFMQEIFKAHDFDPAKSPGACVLFVYTTIFYNIYKTTRTTQGVRPADDFLLLLRAHKTVLEKEAARAASAPESQDLLDDELGGVDGV